MSSYSNEIKAYVERYKAEHGDEAIVDTHDIALWAFNKGLHKPNVKTIIDSIAADISRVFREEYRTDKFGRRYRANHAVTRKKDGKTLSLWADLDDPQVPHSHFAMSFSQRRQQIVGDCLQLKTDVDVFNEKHADARPIQMILDFTLDVEELQQTRGLAA